MKFRMLLAVILFAGCVSINRDVDTSMILVDSDIAMVMRVVNLAEVREGELARTKATDAGVKDFAVMMVNEHTVQNNKAEAEMARADIASSDTALSRQVDANSGVAADRLRELSGAEFDRAYIEHQVSGHQAVLSLIDTRLMPNVKKKVVKEQLTALRKLTDAHLTKVKQIQGALPR